MFQSLEMSFAQNSTGPFSIKNSAEYTTGKGYKLTNVLTDKEDITQVSVNKMESVTFQKFSKDLKLVKENTVNTSMLVGDNSSYERMVNLKNKSYLFTREVNKNAHTEGIAAIEYNPDKMNFNGKQVKLFQSSDKVKSKGGGFVFGFAYIMGEMYDFQPSLDKTKFLYQYTLTPKEKKDKLNKDIIGLNVYDENLSKLWGGEYQMPYTEANMDNLSYTLADDGKVYLVTKVMETDKGASKKESKNNYHFEIFVYEKEVKKPKIIQIKLDNYYPTDAYLYEDANHDIVIAGFYSKDPKKREVSDGFYTVKLDVNKSVFSKINGGYYEIPNDIIKASASKYEKRKIEKAEKKGDEVGLTNLRIRKLFTAQNGSIKIVAEQYLSRTTYVYTSRGMQVRYETLANDIYVASIGNDGKLEWMRKIPKRQYTQDLVGAALSLNSFMTGNDLHIFFADHIKNFKLPPDKRPYVHSGRGGFLCGVNIDQKGTVTTYNLCDLKAFKTNFFIRYFVNGNKNNLVNSARRKKKNILFSINSTIK